MNTAAAAPRDIGVAPLLALQRIRTNAQFAMDGGAVFDLQRCVDLCDAALGAEPQRCESRAAADDVLTALRAIVIECAGPGKPFSGDSYLPPELLDPARAALAKVDAA